jgi:hypothetical protein
MRTTPRLSSRLLLTGAAALSLTACEGSNRPDGNAAIRFSSPAVAGQSTSSGAGLTIEGTNGSLELTDIKLVVDEFELKPVGSNDSISCREREDSPRSDDDCSDFELRLFVADVPLGSGTVTVANDRIREGTYGKLEFEVKDLSIDDDDDDDDSSRAAAIAQVLATLRQSYADWPAGASMMIEGTFTPTNGDARAFRAYFDAEVEVEQRLLPPLEINGTSQGVTVALRPDLWFKRSNGTVRDLSAFDFATTNWLVELEVEFDHGVKVEVGR